jgi:hypothetical protein
MALHIDREGCAALPAAIFSSSICSYFNQYQATLPASELPVPGDSVAGNRGAAFVQRLAPSLRAGTRHWTRLRSSSARPASGSAPRMGPTLRVEPIGPGEERKKRREPQPIHPIGDRHAPGPRVNPGSGDELLTRPVRRQEVTSRH